MMLQVTCQNALAEGSVTRLSAAQTRATLHHFPTHMGQVDRILLPLKLMAKFLLTFVFLEEVALEFGLPLYFRL